MLIAEYCRILGSNMAATFHTAKRSPSSPSQPIKNRSTVRLQIRIFKSVTRHVPPPSAHPVSVCPVDHATRVE